MVIPHVPSGKIFCRIAHEGYIVRVIMLDWML